MKTTFTKPPKTIYDVLHSAEEAGVEIPPEVDKWWFNETIFMEKEKEKEK